MVSPCLLTSPCPQRLCTKVDLCEAATWAEVSHAADAETRPCIHSIELAPIRQDERLSPGMEALELINDRNQPPIRIVEIERNIKYFNIWVKSSNWGLDKITFLC